MSRIERFEDIPLNQLEIGTSQVRSSDTGEGISELADSIAKVGLLEPILVSPPGPTGKYDIILGQRRFLAHQELGLHSIKAGILSDHVEEIEAKVLSVTENLVRRDLNRKDLIDVCTYLYKQYASINAVVAETGLPFHKVSQYVKYDRLMRELKDLVDTGEVDVKAALRAQDALLVEGEPDPQEAVKLAKEMASMSGAQQKRIQDELKANPDVPVDQVIEQAKSKSRVIQVVVTLGQQIHTSLGLFARDEDTSVDEAASQLIQDGLASLGYGTGGGTN